MPADPDVPLLCVRALGVTVAIETPDQGTRDRLARQWSRAVVGTEDEPPVETIPALTNGASEAALDYGLTTRVTLAALRATAGRRVNLHAGGLADEQSRVLAMVAASGTGKTTATRALATRLGYVSDETVSIDPDGTVFPHPKPLSVIVEPGSRYDKVQLSPDDLSLLPTPEKATLARLVVLQRGGDGPKGLRHLRTAQALLELVEQSSSMSQLPRPLQTLARLVRDCGGVRALTYDEIEDHLDELVALLDDDDQPSVEDEHVVWHEGQDTWALTGGQGPVLARKPFAEAAELGDELVVLTESHAWLLADLTAMIWLHLARPSSLAELVAAAELRFGAHDRAEEVIGSALATLEEEGLVGWGTLA